MWIQRGSGSFVSHVASSNNPFHRVSSGSWHWQCQFSFKICKFGLGSPFASTAMGIVIQILQENGIKDNRLRHGKPVGACVSHFRSFIVAMVAQQFHHDFDFMKFQGLH